MTITSSFLPCLLGYSYISKGNPWLALVIDPLYSLAHEKIQVKAFRVYPPDHDPPANQTPDGKIVKDDKVRIAKWGACWNRYYELKVKYFISSMAKKTLKVLSDKFSWQKILIGSGKQTRGKFM